MILNFPTDTFYIIREYLTISDWCKLSRTNKKTAELMQKKLQELKSLYNSLSSSLLSLQQNYITECGYSFFKPEKNKKNFYVASYDEKNYECALQLEGTKHFTWFTEMFHALRKDYFVMENLDDISQKLKPNQFFVCLRLGEIKATRLSHYNDQFYTSILEHFFTPPDHQPYEFKRTIHEFRLVFPVQCKIGNIHKEVIMMAAKHAENKLNPRTLSSYIDYMMKL